MEMEVNARGKATVSEIGKRTRQAFLGSQRQG
jgi:hypothetical protein